MSAEKLLSILLAICSLLQCNETFAEDSGLRAGIAKIDITPTQPCVLCGYASRTNLSTGVHDPLSARAIAFEQNGRKLVFVSADIIGLYRDVPTYFRQAILETCKLQPSELVLAGIHTHSAPTPSLDEKKTHPNNVAYTTMLRGLLVKLVQEALDRLHPVDVGVGVGASAVGVNRRQLMTDKTGHPQIRLGRNPDGVTDHDVQVLQIRERGNDRAAAVMFAYATHSTSLGAKNLVISGDVHGLAEQFIEKHLGDVVSPGFAGASGNIDPWFRVLPEFKTNGNWIPEPVLLGTMLGEEVLQTSTSIRQFSHSGPINSKFKSIELPAKNDPQNPPLDDYTNSAMAITVARIGDTGFVGLGGEIFNEIGRAIKAASPFATTFILTHCNGGAGYLPTKEAYAEGGYEVKSTRFAPEAAAVVVKEVIAMLKDLKAN